MANRAQPAPGQLALLQELVNTKDIESTQDQLATPAQVSQWFAERGLLRANATVGDAEWRLTLEVREALRALLLANNGAPLDPAAVAVLTDITRRVPLMLEWRPDGSAQPLPLAHSLPGALGRLLVIAWIAMVDGTWPRLKACRNEECQWAFYDLSKNHSATWCTMAICGSRLKARSYRKRLRQPAR